MGNSWSFGFLLDREASVRAILTSINYCVLPLAQCELEIPCRFEISMPPAKKEETDDGYL